MDEESIKRIFDSHDADGSGSIDKGECEAVLKEAGVPDDRCVAIAADIMSADTDKDGKVSWDEFKKYMNS